MFLSISALNVAMGVRDYFNESYGGMVFSLIFAVWMLNEALYIEHHHLKKDRK